MPPVYPRAYARGILAHTSKSNAWPTFLIPKGHATLNVSDVVNTPVGSPAQTSGKVSADKERDEMIKNGREQRGIYGKLNIQKLHF